MRRSTACPAHVVFNQVWDERFGYPGARSGRKGQNARFMIEVAAHRGYLLTESSHQHRAFDPCDVTDTPQPNHFDRRFG